MSPLLNQANEGIVLPCLPDFLKMLPDNGNIEKNHAKYSTVNDNRQSHANRYRYLYHTLIDSIIRFSSLSCLVFGITCIVFFSYMHPVVIFEFFFPTQNNLKVCSQEVAILYKG